MKKCNKCNKEYPLEMFHKNKQSPDGRKHECKNCKSIKDRKLVYQDIVAFIYYD